MELVYTLEVLLTELLKSSKWDMKKRIKMIPRFCFLSKWEINLSNVSIH